jgi:phosphate transport system substrate-binding protein
MLHVWKKQAAVMAATLLVSSGLGWAAQPTVDPELPAYQKAEGVSGSLNSIGSDTMNNLLKLWGEAFRKLYPGVNIQFEGKGSSTAPPALIAGTAQLGPMSRAMKPTEIDEFEKKYGFKPTQVRTSLDALAVFVHKDNPVQGLSLPRLDAIFSKNRKLGFADDVTTWGQVGLAGDWAAKPLSIYGRNSASGTYGYFKSEVLGGGDFKDEVKEQPGSASVVQGITEDRFGIGYSGIGYITSGVRAVPLSAKEDAAFVEPSMENVMNHTYPLARYLYIYVVKNPERALDPLVHEFLKFVLSREGQEIVIRDGYLPISAKVAQAELAMLAGNPAGGK